MKWPRRQGERGSALIAVLAAVAVLATIVACMADSALGRVQVAWHTRARQRQGVAVSSAQAVWSSCASLPDSDACFQRAQWRVPRRRDDPWRSCFRQAGFAYEVRASSQAGQVTISVDAAPPPPLPADHPCAG